MPRTCLACSHSERESIDKALVAGETLRNIAKRVSISPAGLLRHKSHVSQAIVKASEEREELLGEDLLDDMRRVQRKAWELLSKAESEGDHRGAIVALREVRGCLESLGDMLARTEGQPRITLGLEMIGEAPLHKWEKLPASYAALLPGKPEGELYIVRPHVAERQAEEIKAKY